MPLQIAAQKSGVVWSGSFFAHHSLALVNRELTLALLRDPSFSDVFDLFLEETDPRTFDPETDPRLQPLAACLIGVPAQARITVRHRWPPDFRPLSSGKSVLCQPWEFGSLPREWVSQIGRSVDEVWAYTDFVRQTYVESGVPAAKVHIVPLGIDPGRFHPRVEPFDFARHQQTRAVLSDDYKFLFVGGTISRKGIEVLLDAFDRSFRAGDPVTLIIKDFGTESFYANQGSGLLIRALQAKPGGARIVYLTEDLTESEMAALYAACDCVVQPYRGEGYGLPIAEAMACGKPVIVTGAGAAMDFAGEDNAYLIPAERQDLAQTHISGMELVSRPYWFEPDRDRLGELMRHVVANPAEARLKGARAAKDIVAGHTWAHAAARASARLKEIGLQSVPAFTSYSLPMGLANFGLSALNGLELPAELEEARYEDRKQTALKETRASDWQHAALDLEACLRDRPDDWETLNALAVARFRTGDREAALALLRRGVASAPSPRDFHHNLAFVLLSAKDMEEAGEALEHALIAFRYSPQDAEIRRTLDRAREHALHSARRILRAYPGSRRALAKRDARYRALMDAYHQVEEALKPAVPQTSAVISVGAPSQTSRQRISLVMIVKNEERFLRKCLASVKDVVDEIVIVDTGSTDSTPQIAREFGARLVSHQWTDDFSEARNVALAHATGDWALWLDADEEIAPESRENIRQAVETAEPLTGGFMVQLRNWLQSTSRQEDTDMAIHHACRLFRLLPGVRFEGRIHEQNLRSLQNMGYSYGYLPGLTLDHFGYATEIMTLRNKHERFIRMLTREVEECPDPTLRHFHLFNLGNAYFTLGDMENAVVYLRRAADQPDLKEEFTAILFTELATALHRLGQAEQGLDVCREADRLGMEQSGIEFARGFCLLHLLRYSEAEASFRRAVRIGLSGAPLAQTGDRGTASYKARYGLALALVGQDRYEEALVECGEALAGQPRFVDARYLKSIVLKKLGRLEEARAMLEITLQQAPDHTAARKDLGHVLFELADYAGALPILEAAGRTEPNDYDTNARLAVCCEYTGRLPEARSVYQRLRSLAPGSAEVCVNLGRVLAAFGSDAEAIDCFTEAIRLDPEYANAYFNAGDLLYSLAHYDRAADTYMAGLRVSPSQPSGFFVLGNCFAQTRNYEAAVVSYKEALSQDPDHAEARHNLSLIEALADDVQAA